MNIKEIGLASCKFSTYMLAGLPTLLSECRTYQHILQGYAIGQLVTKEKDLFYHIHANSLANINRATGQQFYKEVLDPTEFIITFINSLIS